MNVTLVHLAVAHALTGPYLSLAPKTRHTALTVMDSRFTAFFSNFLFAASAVKLSMTKTHFKHFQNSAISLNRADTTYSEKVYNSPQEVPGDYESAAFNLCTFYDCQAQDTGGAISSTAEAAVFVENCGFLKCTAQNNGGAIYVVNASNTPDGWFGSWNSGLGLPGLQINGSCFSECYVTGTPSGTDESSKVGYVLYTRMIQAVMNDFSALDCSRSGAAHGAVFGAWINDLVTRYGNLSIGNSVRDTDLSAFNIQFGGSNDGSIKHVKKTGIDHSFHVTSGFRCRYLYRSNVQDMNSVGFFVKITVLDMEAVPEAGQAAVFYVDFTGKEESSYSDYLKDVQVSECNVFLSATGETDYTSFSFYLADGYNNAGDGHKPAETIANCQTNVQAWAQDGKITVATERPNIELELTNGQYCDYEPLDTTSDTNDMEDMTDAPDPEGGDPSKSGGLKPGEIAGIIIAVLIIIVIIIVIIILIRRRRDFTTNSTGGEEEKKDAEESETTTTNNTLANPDAFSANYDQTQMNQMFEGLNSLEMRSFEEEEGTE